MSYLYNRKANTSIKIQRKVYSLLINNRRGSGQAELGKVGARGAFWPVPDPLEPLGVCENTEVSRLRFMDPRACWFGPGVFLVSGSPPVLAPPIFFLPK